MARVACAAALFLYLFRAQLALPAALDGSLVGDDGDGLARDDECGAAGTASEQQCTLSAAQLRARRVIASHRATAAPAAACTADWDNCLTTRCCSSKGYVCYEKDSTYAQCMSSQTCTPGINPNDEPRYATPWTCNLLSDAPVEPPLGSMSSTPPPAFDTPELANNVSAAGPTNPIVIRGPFLYDSVTGKRFFAKGIAYNPRNINYDGATEGPKSKKCKAGSSQFAELAYTDDVAADELESQWGPNLEAIAKLGANTVRLYNIKPENSHKKFMAKAAELGLYVIVPLTRMDWGFLPAFPSPGCYNRVLDEYGNVGVNLLTSAKLIVKQFSEFDNTLMFTVANEMPVNDHNGYAAYPCVKALTRDIHRYQANCTGHMRRVPLIYSDMDMGSPTRVHIAKYLSCALESEDDAIDAYGLNVYSWCDTEFLDDHGKPSFRYSPYQAIVDDFEAYNKPLLFTEFGCNTGEFETTCPYKGGRTWVDVQPMFRQMGEVLSGAVAFEFSMEKNQFGIALTPGFLEGQSRLRLLDSYYALQRQFRGNRVSSEWDSGDAAQCSFQPSDVAPLSRRRENNVCPGRQIWQKLQEDHDVDQVGDWDVLPPAPPAPLAAVDNQTECPALELSEADRAENCCHAECAE